MLEHLLEVIDKTEFDTLAQNIKQSLRAHRQWMHKISLAIVAARPIDDTEFCAQDAHLHCRFGQWLQGVLCDEIFQQGSFLKIESLHQQLHQKARLLMGQLKAQGCVNTNTFREFLDVQNEFFDLALLIFEFSVVNQHQFDTTTKLMTRRSADAILAHEKHRLSRFGDYQCMIALADLDHFKQVNDTHGHATGDKVLEATANIFHQSLRRHDTVARYGGEEFLFIIPGSNLDEVSKLIERTRCRLESTAITCDGKSIHITASFGVTPLSTHEEFKASIKRADRALYQAKANGRNQVQVIE